MRISLLLTFFVSLYTTTAQVNIAGHEISLKVDGLTDTAAIIGYHYGSQKLVLDTVDIDQQSRCIISGDEALPVGLYFLYTPSFYFEFVVKEQYFQLNLDNETGYRNIGVFGSEENELFADFQNTMADIQRAQVSLSEELSSAGNSEDSTEIMTQLRGVAGRSKVYRDSLVNANPDSFVADFLSLMSDLEVPEFSEILDDNERRGARYSYYKSHYFDRMGDPSELMRTPVFHGYVMKYFNELVVPQADSVKGEIKKWLDPIEDDEDAFRYWLMTLYQKYQESNIMGMDAVMVYLSDNYFLTDKVTFMSEEQKKDIEKELKFIRPNLIGSVAPKMNLLDTSLRAFDMDQIKAKYMVLFFYDPDCGHCKKKTPVLRDAYGDLKNAGAEVIAICTITEVDKWKKFVKEHQLDWINLGDPYHRNNFRMEYNVRTTPQLFVLDKERKIIAKKLDVERVLDFIQDYEMLLGDQ